MAYSNMIIGEILV